MAKTQEAITQVEALSAVQKVAVLLLALDQESAGMVLSRLEPRAVEDVTRALAMLGTVSPDVIDTVVSEFYHLLLAQSWTTEGGMHYACMLIRKSLPPDQAERIIQQIREQIRQAPFAFLQRAESANLLTFIQDEHPQTIALILSHVAHKKAAEILAGLPSAKQIEVIKRIANMDQTNPEVIREVERGLEARLSSMLMQRLEAAGGIESVASMLNMVDRSTEKGIMEGLETEDPDLVEQIRRLMFVFEDILLVDDKGIQTVLKEVDNDELALALKTASEELKAAIFRNMSERARELIQEDMQYMGPVRVSDVEAAQQRIVDIVRRLEDAGEIMIAGRGGEKEMVV